MPATFKQDEISVREELNVLSGIKVIHKADKENTILILPTSDPLIANALWNNSGVLNISSG